MAKYGSLAQKKVKRAMEEMKSGKLKSGRSGKKVTNPKQAVAIGLSEARELGGKVPKKSATKKTSTKRATTKMTTAKKSATKKATSGKSAAKKTSSSRARSSAM